MSELTVGYGQVVLSLFTDLGIRPNILAVADNIETMKVIVQSGTRHRDRAARLRRQRGRARRAQGAVDRAGAQRRRSACSAAASRCRAARRAIWRRCARR